VEDFRWLKPSETLDGLGMAETTPGPLIMVLQFVGFMAAYRWQVAVAEKSNEIVAIPALLDMMAIEGAVVTIDAMGCQRAIAEKIVGKKADYIIALKGNQGTLQEDVKVFAAEQKANGFADTPISRHETSTATMVASKSEPIRRSMM
jgi:predicted transposase YbfD/YdcC